MQQIAQQLDRVRRHSRLLLIVQRVCQWLAALIPAAIVLAVIDYALRLPGTARLVMLLAVVAVALLWISTRLIRAARFAPSLPDLALRVERLYPQLRGKLASAVEFHQHRGELAHLPRAAALADASVGQTQALLAGAEVGRIIDRRRTAKLAGIFTVTLLVLLGLVAAQPSGSRTALARWLSPYGDAAWPLRNDVEAVADRTLWPIDTPLPLRAQVNKGYSSSLRVRATYRVVEDGRPGPWQEVLLNEQAAEHADNARHYERLIDLPLTLSRSLTGEAPGAAHVEYFLEAGDDRTDTQRIELAARPAVASVVARITPPAYATGLAAAQTVKLHEQTGAVASASALAGSSVELQLTFNKPVNAAGDVGALLPGFADLGGVAFATEANATRARAVFTLGDAGVQSPARLADAHGLTNLAERSYRIEAVADNAPAVSLTEPTTDQPVTANAVVELAALAQDDVGVEELQIAAQRPVRGESGSDQTTDTTQLARRTARQATLDLTHTLDLATLDLAPGDQVLLTAVAQDVFDLNGSRHEPVVSAPRLLKIIDEAELAAQVRADLAGVRQQAVRLDQSQEQVQQQDDAQRAASQQSQIGRRLESQDEQVQRLEQRVQDNRLDDPALSELMNRARQLLNDASQSSQSAQQSLNEAQLLEGSAQQMREASEQGTQLQREADRAAAEAARLANEAQSAEQLARQMQEMARDAAARGDEDAQAQAESAEQAQQQAQALRQQAQAQAQQAQQAQQQANAASPQAAQAQQQAQQARAQAQQQQQQVRQSLQELADMLDQGANALALQQELRQITQEQNELADMTRKLLPRTAGLDREDLPEDVQAQLDEIAERQAQLAEQAAEFARNARQAAAQMRNQGDTDQEQAAAETLEEAADIAERQGLEQDMQAAAQQARQNQLSQAGGAQADAQQTLSQMSQAMGGAQQKQQELLKRRLAKLEQLLANLIERQTSQLAALDAVADANIAARLPELAPAQTAIRQATMAAEATANADPATAEAGGLIGKAIEAQARAVVALRGAAKPGAVNGEKDALARLEEALAKVKEQQDQQQQQDEQDKARDELRQAYEALAKQQAELYDKAAELEAKPQELTRREQAVLRTLGNEQEAVRVAANELGKKVEDTLVFAQTHRRIDAAATRAAEALGQAQADSLVLLDQQQVAKLLQAMAEALAEDQPDDKFEQPPGDKGGGGGGGGGGGEEPLVPDIAELKLLKGAQEAIYDETRVLADVLRDDPSRSMIQRVESVGQAQSELHDMGAALIEKVTRELDAE